MSAAILQRSCGQAFGLPALQQNVDVLALERACAHLAEAGFAQLVRGRDYTSSLESIGAIAEQVQSLNRQAIREYTPVVENILGSRSRDTHHIERTLDGLLDFCGYEPALVLYKKLCRRYLELDPLATTSYINAYREMWDSEE